jgi:hypothetical protein
MARQFQFREDEVDFLPVQGHGLSIPLGEEIRQRRPTQARLTNNIYHDIYYLYGGAGR